MAYNRLAPLGGNGGNLDADNIWTGHNQFDNVTSFENRATIDYEATADIDIPNLQKVIELASGGYIPKSPVKAVANYNLPLTGFGSVINSQGQTVTIADGDYICASNQTSPLNNARMVVRAGHWELCPDFEFESNQVNTIFTETSTGASFQQIANPAIVGVDPMQFVLFKPATKYVGDGSTISIVDNIVSVLDNAITNVKVASNAAILASKIGLITGFISGAGTVSASDTLLQALNKLDGNASSLSSTVSSLTSVVATKAPISAPIFTSNITIDAVANFIKLGNTSNATVITTAALTGSRTFTLPDDNSNSVVPTTATTNQFLTHIDSDGVQNKAQPSFSNISGTLSSAAGGTGVNNGSNTCTLSGSFNLSGGYNATFVTTATTSLTLPTSGTLAEISTTVPSVENDDGNILINEVSGAPVTGTNAIFRLADTITIEGVYLNTQFSLGGPQTFCIHHITGSSGSLSNFGIATVETSIDGSNGGKGFSYGVDNSANYSWLYSRDASNISSVTKMGFKVNNDFYMAANGRLGVGTATPQGVGHFIVSEGTIARYGSKCFVIDTGNSSTGLGGTGMSFGVDSTHVKGSYIMSSDTDFVVKNMCLNYNFSCDYFNTSLNDYDPEYCGGSKIIYIKSAIAGPSSTPSNGCVFWTDGTYFYFKNTSGSTERLVTVPI